MPESTGIESIGYIMFECGLEGVGVKIVKRSHFEKSENSKEELAEMAGAGAAGGTSGGGFNLNDLVGQGDGATASGDGGATSKAEAAWRLITKKPPTPKTPKEKFQPASDSNIAGDSSSAAEQRKSTPKPPDEDVEKGTSTSNAPPGAPSCFLYKYSNIFYEKPKTSWIVLIKISKEVCISSCSSISIRLIHLRVSSK